MMHFPGWQILKVMGSGAKAKAVVGTVSFVVAGTTALAGTKIHIPVVRHRPRSGSTTVPSSTPTTTPGGQQTGNTTGSPTPSPSTTPSPSGSNSTGNPTGPTGPAGSSGSNGTNPSAGATTPTGSGGGSAGSTASGDGCAAYPSFPDSACTGWQHTGVALKKVPSQVTSGTGWHWEGGSLNYVRIDGNNAVLDGLDITGCVYLDNSSYSNVKTATIKRSRITGGCDYLIRLDNANIPTALTLADVELVGGAVQTKGSGITWLRVDAHDFTGKAAMLGSSTTIEDSYIHDIVCHPPDHQSGIGTNGGASNIVMRHNHVDLKPTDCTSGGIANYDDFGAFHDILIEKNLINSGGYCLKAGFEDNNAAGNSGMQVLNNVFGRKYFANCGTFGVVSNWMPSVAGNIWSGNTWGDGAAATGAHALGSTVNP